MAPSNRPGEQAGNRLHHVALWLRITSMKTRPHCGLVNAATGASREHPTRGFDSILLLERLDSGAPKCAVKVPDNSMASTSGSRLHKRFPLAHRERASSLVSAKKSGTASFKSCEILPRGGRIKIPNRWPYWPLLVESLAAHERAGRPAIRKTRGKRCRRPPAKRQWTQEKNLPSVTVTDCVALRLIEGFWLQTSS